MPLAGILAQAMGESPAQQKVRIEEATKNARDLTGLVRHRKKPKTGGESDAATSAVDVIATSNSKRKLGETEAEDSTTKKVKMDE
jgi:HAT1-interacting factor 1